MDEKETAEEKLFAYNGKSIRPTSIKSDIPIQMRERAYELAFESLEKFTAEKELSEYIKKHFDEEFEPEWQIVIGKDFSVAFSHEIENFVFFQIEDCYFLFYKL